MLVFIDDSGDPGFKLGKGSTDYFIIAMIIFRDELEAEKTALTIKELKRQLGFDDSVEFRFFKSSKDNKIKFLEAINAHDFTVRCLVVDKSVIYSPELQNNKDKFYSYFIKEVLKHSTNVLEAKVKIDGSGDRIFRRNFLSYLRRELTNDQRRVMRHCKLVDSRNNVLIQMADMIAGSINRSYGNKGDAKLYKSIIHKHIESEWKFR